MTADLTDQVAERDPDRVTLPFATRWNAAIALAHAQHNDARVDRLPVTPARWWSQ
jgi:hypothetical protein